MWRERQLSEVAVVGAGRSACEHGRARVARGLLCSAIVRPMTLLLVPVLAVASGCARSGTERLRTVDSGAERRDSGVAANDSGVLDSGVFADAATALDAGTESRCAQLSQADCESGAGPNCLPRYCDNCGTDRYVSCAAPGDPPPACPDVDCQCEIRTDPNQCAGDGQCRWQACPGCAGDPGFAACVGMEEMIGCPPVLCPPECAELDEPDCAADARCHRVFSDDDPACLCDASGCCTSFLRCADAPLALCTPQPLTCRRPEPFCVAPYTVSYDGMGCYEGCALMGDCAP